MPTLPVPKARSAPLPNGCHNAQDQEAGVTHGVIHYGTGFTGTQALRGIIEHLDLELVGLAVRRRPLPAAP